MINVTGPAWPSTAALRGALADIDNPRGISITYGASPCDKFTAMDRMRRAGVPTPTTTRDIEEARDWTHWGIETWGRKLKHSQGRDIARFNTDTTLGGIRWCNRDFWVQRVQDVDYEFRVHVFNGRAFRTGIKQRNEDVTTRPLSDVIRSDRNGWQLRYSAEHLQNLFPKPTRKVIRDIAGAACGTLDVRLGAVDILLTHAGDLYVLEVNTAPALGEKTLEAYTHVIAEYAVGEVTTV